MTPDCETQPLGAKGKEKREPVARTDLTPEMLAHYQALLKAQQHDPFLDAVDKYKKRVMAVLLLATILIGGMHIVLIDGASLIRLYIKEFGNDIAVVQAATSLPSAAPTCPCHTGSQKLPQVDSQNTR